MESDGITYLVYDKYAGDHNYNNKITLNIGIKELFEGDYEEISDNKAINEFNKFNGVTKIPEDINKNLYKIYLFKKDSQVYTIIGVCNKTLENILKSNKTTEIPNKDFLSKVCRFHTMYTKASQNNGVINCWNNDSHSKNVDEMCDHIITKLGDVTDGIIDNPDFLSCTLYNYQLRSIYWMLNKERSEKNVYYNFNEEINLGNIFYDVIKQNFSNNEERNKVNFNGGALIDEVGLGKTVQMTTLSILNPAKDLSYIRDKSNKLHSRATLVICPNQLAGQWKREIEKMVKKDFNPIIISILTKVHYDKFTYQDLLDADFVIVSSAFLENNCYTSKLFNGVSTSKSYGKSATFDFNKVKQENEKSEKEMIKNPLILFQTNCMLNSIFWHRLVIDEFHEIYTVDKYKHLSNILPLFEAKYKWCVTGTPFDKGSKCLHKMFEFVTNYSTQNLYDDKILTINTIKEHLKSDFFRRNTKKSIIAEYQLPPIKNTVVWLKFSQTERMMYNAYLANPNNDKFSVLLRQLCCHPKLAEEIKETLSNCKTLDDIQKTMVSHYATAMKLSENKLNYLKLRLEISKVVLKRYELKRQKRLLNKLKYKVTIVDFPELDMELVKKLNDNNKYSDEALENFQIKDYEDEESDSEDDEKYTKSITISEKNRKEVLSTIGNAWNLNRITLDNMYENITKLEERIKIFQKDYDGKKTTHDFYNNVMEKIKKTVEKEKARLQKELEGGESDSDSDSDSDEEEDEETCGICLGEIGEDEIGVTKCGHIFCYQCIKAIIPQKHQCPYCKKGLKDNEIYMISYEKPKAVTAEQSQEIKGKNELINKVGTKLANLIYLIKSSDKHTIIFSQWDDLLRKVGDVLDEYGIKNVFCKGNTWQRDKAIRTFNADEKIKVIMLSSDSAASGANLTKASQVILLDPVFGNYEYRRNTEWQAIGRAHRMGQTKEVEVIRFIVKDTVEEEIYKQNLEEDKKHVQNIKIFESTDEDIKLSNDKLEEINKEANDTTKKTKKVVSKGTKITATKKPVEKVIENSEDEFESDYDD